MSDGLIEIPAEAPRGVGYWSTVAFVLLTSIGIVVVTAAIDTLRPLPLPRLVGAEKVEHDRMERDARWSDGTLARLVEYRYRIRSRVRAAIARPYATFLFHTLHEGTSDVHVGSDGWLFLTRRAAPPKGAVDSGARSCAATHAAISRRLATLGMRHVMLPLPRKAVVFEEYLPPGISPRSECDLAIVPAMRALGVETVDVLAVWRAWSGETAYPRTDTHWSTTGVRLAVEELAGHTGLIVPEAQREGVIVHGKRRPLAGVLFGHMNVQPGPSDEWTFTRNPVGVRVDGRSVRPGGNTAPVVACGSSFTEFPELREFLSYYLGEPTQLYPARGSHGLKGLLLMLGERPPGQYPSVVVEEFPNHLIVHRGRSGLSWSVRPEASEILATYAPPRTRAMDLPAAAWKSRAKTGVELEFTGGRFLGRLSGGHLAHDGGGLAEIQIDVEVRSGPLRVRLRCGNARLTADLVAGRQTVSLPVITAVETSAAVDVSIATVKKGGAGRFVLHSINVVTATDTTSSQALTVGEVRRVDGATTQALTFAGSPRMSRHDTLLLGLATDGAGLDQVRITVEASDGLTQQSFAFAALRPGAQIVLSPGLLIGHELGSILITGSPSDGLSRASWVATAALVPLATEPRH